MTTTPQVDVNQQVQEVEQRVRYVFARDPYATVRFKAKPSEIDSPEVRKLVATAFSLQKQRKQPTIEALAAAGAASLADLEAWSLQCTTQMFDDFDQYGDIIRLGALFRNMLKMHGETRERLLTNPNLFAVEQIYEQTRKNLLAMYNPLDDGSPVDLIDILELAESSPIEETIAFPTGFTCIDEWLHGGVRLDKLLVIAGAYKGGKTSLLRSMLLNMALNGVRVTHFAHDGGKARRHMYYYWAMACHRLTMERTISCELPHLSTGERLFAFHPDNLELFLKRPNDLPFKLTPRLVEVIHDARQLMSNMKNGGDTGFLRIIDGTKLQHSVERFVRYAEEQYADGMQVFAMDHAGKLTTGGGGIFDQTRNAALAFSQFVEEHRVAGIVLSQLNEDGVNEKDDDDSYSAKLRGGQDLAQECDDLMITRKLDDYRFKLYYKFARESESMKKQSLARVGSSGILVQAS